MVVVVVAAAALLSEMVCNKWGELNTRIRTLNCHE